MTEEDRKLGEPELTAEERAWVRRKKLEDERWAWFKDGLERGGMWAKWFLAISAAIYAVRNGLIDWLMGGGKG